MLASAMFMMILVVSSSSVGAVPEQEKGKAAVCVMDGDHGEGTQVQPLLSLIHI